MKFKKDLKPIPTSDTCYDLFLGGYFKPEKMLEDPNEIKQVKEAISTVRIFMNEAIEVGAIEEI